MGDESADRSTRCSKSMGMFEGFCVRQGTGGGCDLVVGIGSTERKRRVIGNEDFSS